METRRLSWIAFALFGLTLALFEFGCAGKPCETSSQCGNGEVCASERCQALSCSSEQTWAAVDPATGQCRPLPACGNADEVRGWKSCQDPCKGQGENSCIADPRCQPVYVTHQSGAPTPCAAAGAEPAGNSATTGATGVFDCGGSGDRSFVGCRANPLPVDPCAGLDQAACQADARCVDEPLFATAQSCECAAGQACNCPDEPPSDGGSGFECRVKTCSDYTTASDCTAHPDCEVVNATDPPTPAPEPGPFEGASDPTITCVSRSGGSCFGMDQATCLAHAECHPVGAPCYCPADTSCACDGGKFLFCEPDDGLARCSTDSDCGSGQRCSNDDPSDLQCAPPIGSGGGGGVVPQGTPAGSGTVGSGTVGSGTTGSGSAGPLSDPVQPGACAGLCVPQGCAGYGEARCNADPSCQAIYDLQCSPYGNGGGVGGGAVPVDCGGGALPANASGVAGCGQCEPTFTGCTDAKVVGSCDTTRSLLLRDPAVVDDPTFTFGNVMTHLAGATDPAVFVTSWLNQIGTNQTVDGRQVAARSGAAAFLATLPRRSDGNLDLTKLDFQPTALANRIDLAGAKDCGEARITFALASGETDRRDRMTVIVELHQPDDGARCATTAQKWLALSSLSGAALNQAVRAIYQPLLSPAGVAQVRTNEFLVGQSTDPTQMNAWELREWHIGADGLLHLAPLAEMVDPQLAETTAFATWANANAGAILNGAAQIPENFLALSATENGSRIQLPSDTTGQLSTALNRQACAGCHTTETNTAFAHVAERFAGQGRAEISQFLLNELPRRANHLLVVAAGRLDAVARNTPKLVH